MAYLNSKFQSGFSPQNIPGLVVWLNAADSNSITQSGGAVSLWKDRSPNALDVSQNTGAAQPTYESNVQNGLPAIRFTTSQMMQSTQNFTVGKEQTWFVSFKTITGTNYFFVEQGPNTNTSDGQFLYGGNNSLMYMKRGGATRFIDDSIGRGTSPFSSNVWYVAGLSTNNTTGGTGDTYWSINGVSRGTLLSGTISGSATNALYINNTSRVPASNYYGEIIIYNQALSSNQMRLVERYLANKWGVTLSNTHPYFSVPASLRPFNPLDIPGCALWLDSADYGSFTFSSGTSVSQWNDKSGNGRNFSQATAGNQPTWSNSFLSSPGVYFNSANSQRLSGTYVQAGTGGRHTYIVFYDSNTTANLYGNPPLLYMADSNSTGAGADWRAAVDASNNYLSIDIFAGAKTMRTSPNVTSMRTQRCIALWGMPTGATVDTTYVYGNGTQFTTSVASVNLTQTINTFNTSLTTIGGYAVGSSWVNAVISEIIHYSNELTSNQRQQVELYLAEKWGLRGNLASSNTLRLYESLSPVFNPTLLSNCTLWLDAADDGTMTFTGANLSTWRDKSGSGNNGAAVGTITKTGTINGTSVLQWTLASGANYVYGTLSNSTTSASLFAVFNMSSTTATFARALSVDSNGRDWPSATGTAAIMKYGPFVSQRSDTITSSSVTSNYDAPVIVSTMFDGTSNYMHVNGTAGSNGASTGSFSYLRYGVGRDNAGDGPSMIGSVAEVLHFPRFLTTAERQLVEGYLANKWNISLPNNHPYKTIRV